MRAGRSHGIQRSVQSFSVQTKNLPYQRHELVVKLLVKQVENRVSLLNHIQEVEVGVLGI